MEMLKFGKFAALSLALAVAVGCSSKGGDTAGEGAVDPNACLLYTSPSPRD